MTSPSREALTDEEVVELIEWVRTSPTVEKFEPEFAAGSRRVKLRDFLATIEADRKTIEGLKKQLAQFNPQRRHKRSVLSGTLYADRRYFDGVAWLEDRRGKNHDYSSR